MSRGTITVVSQTTFEDMVCPSQNAVKSKRSVKLKGEQTSIRGSLSRSKSASLPHDGEHLPLAVARPSTPSDLSQHWGDWLSEKRVQNVQEKTAYGSTKVQNICTSLLENESDLIKKIEDCFAQNAALHKKKRFLLSKRWHENVYFPLQEKLEQEMDGKRYKVYEKSKRMLYSEYLNYLNRKGDVFLDVISQNEYDPLQLAQERPGPLRAVTRPLDDPLLHQETKRKEEQSVLLACDGWSRPIYDTCEAYNIPSLPRSRTSKGRPDCNAWASFILRDIASETRSRSHSLNFSPLFHVRGKQGKPPRSPINMSRGTGN